MTAPIDLVVLCGGRGVRLRPATDSMPKAMVPVDGRPIIDHVVDFLTAQGINRVHFCLGYLGHIIRAHYDRALPYTPSFSDMGEDASMLQRLHAVRDRVGERFLVAYCDTFIDLSVADVLAAHHHRGARVTILTAPIRNPFGIVTVDGAGRVASFREKPVQNHFIGFSVMERDILDHLSPDLLAMPDGSGLIELFQRLITAGDLAAFEHRGLNITFNTAPERVEAERMLRRYYTVAEDEAAY